MLIYQQLSQGLHHHQNRLKQNGHLGSRLHYFQHRLHHGHHPMNHKSCRYLNQQARWMHHLGLYHRILQGHQPIRLGLYQIAEHHRFHRRQHRPELRIGLVSQSYT